MNGCDQVEVINALAYRVMNTYAVQMFMEETRQKAHVAWAAMCKMRRAEKKEQKEKEKTEVSEVVKKMVKNCVCVKELCSGCIK